MESMERIDVLKSIEQILVQKAYATGHVSHRADGDWQKQADGSWTPYTGQSDSNPKRYDNRTRFGGDGTLLTQDQVMELQQISDINERKKRQAEMLAENKKDPDSSYEKMKYGEITEEDLKEIPDEEDSNDWEEEDTEGYYGNSGGLRSTIYEGVYDTQISSIGNTEEDDYGNSVPNDEAVENVVRGIMQEWTGDTDDEDAVEAVHDGLKDAVLDRWSSIYVQKSAVRDMKSTPATKNMGF